MSNYVVSLIRTWVPVAIGAVITWLTSAIGLVEYDSTGLVTAVTGLVIAIYYAVVRYLENKYPQIGILLGSTAKPAYVANVSGVGDQQAQSTDPLPNDLI